MFDLVELFCRIDDFWKNFEPIGSSHLICSGQSIPKKPSSLWMSGVITILILFHSLRYRDFKTFYVCHLAIYLKKEFPCLVSYTQFLELKKRALFPLYCFLYTLYGKCTGLFRYRFDFFSCLSPETHKLPPSIQRDCSERQNHYKDGSIDLNFIYGLMEQGELLNFFVSPGNTSDLAPLPALTEGIFGKLFGDKGYISQEIFEKLYSKAIQLITRLKAKVKNKLMHVFDKIVLRKRGMIDSMIGQLKEICQIEHSRHRRSVNCIVNLLSGLAGYSLKANKPRINLQKSSLKFLSDLAV